MPKQQMVINYVPGEECRVAVVEDGNLEELYNERFSAASRVGNIYVGRVNNVERSIQAAFVDFGVEDNGFLHISDLHPQYFPGEDDETTERVGHKTPRRERPPIEHCLRKGDEVIVQVLKEGVGTKGPTLTSYLSIPGRFLVMMPQMDKVGVSRKVEDEEARRSMREILDQLELPEGFGFILRTAGMDRSKVELKRDLAYLQRLWKDMEKRRKGGNRPRLMYSESDLLVRCLRDVMTSDMDEVIIDNEQALMRAERYMKIVAPRTKTKLMHYPGKTPVFHAYGIERQIALIHAREVPLPSGGRLVIDQTEALVAIDVNSGKSRDARDSEDNAYKTNVEAVDEICRQLRLRDLGGIIVNDLIDMRASSHRKDIENRFKERLKRDRAKSTVAAISPFGILEMTRQRMRGSHEQLHFSDCPICRGRGLVQKPDSVAADALRDLATLLDYERVGKVELVVSPRVAGELLSNKRLLLGRIERESAKHVDVRVSEDIPPDRVSFYAYDPSGADIDIDKLPAPKRPADLKMWEFDSIAEPADDWSADPQNEHARAVAAEAEAERARELAGASHEPHPIEIDEPGDAQTMPEPAGTSTEPDATRRRRRRRRGRGRGGDAPEARGADARRESTSRPPVQAAPLNPIVGSPEPVSSPEETTPDGAADGEGGVRRRRRRRRGRGRGGDRQGIPGAESGVNPPVAPGPIPPRVREDRRDPHYAKAQEHPLPTIGSVVPTPRPIPRVPASEITPFTVVATMGDHGDEPAMTLEPASNSQPHSLIEPAPEPTPLPESESGGSHINQIPEGTGSETPGEGGRRRRRRRRRGRGGSGGAGVGNAAGSSAPPGAPAGGIPPPAQSPAPHAPPSRDGRGGHTGPNQRPQGGGRSSPRAGGDRPPRSSARTKPSPDSHAAPAHMPHPKPASDQAPGGSDVASGAGGAKPVRPLYFNRRKLGPSELNKRPKPE
jgi:ribonuclease E